MQTANSIEMSQGVLQGGKCVCVHIYICLYVYTVYIHTVYKLALKVPNPILIARNEMLIYQMQSSESSSYIFSCIIKLHSILLLCRRVYPIFIRTFNIRNDIEL